MLTQKVQELITENLKSGNEVKLTTYRMLATAFNYARTDKMRDLTEEEELEVVSKEAKKRKDAIEALRQAQGKLTKSSNLDEKIKREEEELSILEEFLPAQMSDEELNAIVDGVVKELKPTGIEDMGRVIGAVMGKVKGKADGGRVSKSVKSKIS